MNKKDKSLLLIIDLQKDFINKKTDKLPNKISKLIDSNAFDYIAFTKFINSENNDFYRKLNYKCCLTEDGQNIVIDTKNSKVFCKNVYTALNKEFLEYVHVNNINCIYLCGIDTDACVMKTAVDLFENGLNVKVIENYCMSHSGKKFHKSAIKMLKKLIGNKNVIKLISRKEG